MQTKIVYPVENPVTNYQRRMNLAYEVLKRFNKDMLDSLTLEELETMTMRQLAKNKESNNG